MTDSTQVPDPARLAAWLPTQRWFGDKSRTIATVVPETFATSTVAASPVRFVDATVAFADGGDAHYFLPLAGNAEEGVVDALSIPAFIEWLGAGFTDARTIELASGQGQVQWLTPGSDASWAAAPPRVVTGEQSNSSVMFGSEAILKVFRRLQAGTNPDSEIVAYLTEEGSFTHTPGFLGAIRLEPGGGGESTELAAVQRFVPNDGDCWTWLPGALADSSDTERSELTDAIRLLGRRTGELHAALGKGTSDAFKPVVYTAADTAEVEARLGREVRQTGSMLHRQGACSYDESEELVGALLRDVSHAAALEGSNRIRVHGDYHLGQVLRASGDFVIIDFEGEPSRSMAERRMKHSPLKDVAGMLRSIDYAAASARMNHEGRTSDAEVLAWREEAERAFLDGYMSAIAASRVELVPGGQDQFQRALDLFMIEKALYEVRYELDNRPDWIEIPLGALRRIAGER